MGTRQRQMSQNREAKTNGDTNSKNSTTEKSTYLLKRQRSLQKQYLIVASLGLLALIYVGLNADARDFSSKAIDNIALTLKLQTPTYVVIIDAGSTASRVNVFTFHTTLLNRQLVLDDTLFFETKPGLSAYAKNSKDVEKSLNILLDKARSKIPQSLRASTPLSLRATAGLRLLPDNEAQNILEECKRVFASSGFRVSDNSVAIMDGSDEGIFSWFTTNFLLDKFSNLENDDNLSKNTVAAFDLGGGSTQVTFALTSAVPQKQSKELSAHEKNIHHVSAFNKNISLFTESFLGMGLMAARKDILTHPDNHKNQKKTTSSDDELRAECINPPVSGVEWNYGGQNYIVKGSVDSSQQHKAAERFSRCIEIIKKVVDSAIPHDLPSLREHEIYAFSYYFERATEAGLIDPLTGGIVTVESIYKLASEVCKQSKTDQPFMCLDLSFIYILLHDGFGLDNSSKIFLRKYINGHQLNWALGAAYNILQNDV